MIDNNLDILFHAIRFNLKIAIYDGPELISRGNVENVEIIRPHVFVTLTDGMKTDFHNESYDIMTYT